MNSLEFMQELYSQFGDFEVWKKNDDNWKNWIFYSKATENQRAEANLRSLTKAEVVIDADTPERFSASLEKLKKHDLKYDVWSTCRESHYHIRLIFPEMNSWSDDLVKKFRQFFCWFAEGDPAKGSARTMIALEYKEHFKDSSKTKKLLGELSDFGINSVSQILPEFLYWLNKEKPTNTNTACVVVGTDKEISGHPSESTLVKLRTRPEVYSKIFSYTPIGKRSDVDFVLAKACVELDISFEEFCRVLKSTTWSKIHESKHGTNYALMTFQAAARREREYNFRKGR